MPVLSNRHLPANTVIDDWCKVKQKNVVFGKIDVFCDNLKIKTFSHVYHIQTDLKEYIQELEVNKLAALRLN